MVEGATTEDKSVEPFTTYIYRVRAAGANGALSTPSNEVTVGPPPVGFSQILTEPKDLMDPGQFARGITMTLDANDDPAIAYLFVDPDNNNDEADSTLHFISWSRTQYRWNPPVTVRAVGANDWDIPRNGLSLARDTGANLFGLAHMVKNSELHVAFSDDGGVRWRDVIVAKAEENGLGAPSLALDKGQVFLAYNEDGGDGHRYARFRTGAAADAPEKWTTSTAPLLEKTWDARRPGLSVALDGAGKPALLYWLNPAEGYNMTLAFWRPGEKSAVKVTDSADFQSDSTDSKLAIKGNEASVVAYVRRDNDFFNAAHQVWYARSTDGGATWTPVVPLPNDGMNSMGAPVTVALDSRGRPAATAWVDGGNNSDTRCGQPKLIRQADRGAWTICAPETNGAPTKDVRIPMLAFPSNDKLYFVFRTRGEAPTLKPGLLLWRER